MAWLLDVNILVAILDRDHVHHHRAILWFQDVGHRAWLTCPTTENGAMRIMSLPSYPLLSTTPAEVLDSLDSLRRKGNHSFVGDNVSLTNDPNVDRSRLIASKQITDTYLLTLAIHHGAVLATLDRRLSPIAVRNGEDHVLYL